MKKIAALILTAFFGIMVSEAQYNDSIRSSGSAKAVYLEVGGSGLVSINYDMRLTPTKDGFGFRAGVGGYSINQSRLIIVPLGLNYITSKNNRDYFEAGAGFSIVSNSKGEGEGPFRNNFGFLNLGYRKQPAEGGYFFKASLVPVFGKGFFWP